MKDFFKGISVVDVKVATLVIILLGTVGVALFHFIKLHDVSDNMVTLVGYMIMALTGVSVTEKISRTVRPPSNYNYSNDTNYNQNTEGYNYSSQSQSQSQSYDYSAETTGSAVKAESTVTK